MDIHTLENIPHCFLAVNNEKINDNIENDKINNILPMLFDNFETLNDFIKIYYYEKKNVYEIMNIAWKILQLFMINNFTGPPTPISDILNFFSLDEQKLELLNRQSRKLLSIDSEDLPLSIKYPFLFYFAKTIILESCLYSPTIQHCELLQLLIYNVWLYLFGTSFGCFKTQMMDYINIIKSKITRDNTFGNKLNVEKLFVCFNSCILIYEYDIAKEILELLQVYLEISHKLTGSLGLRMKYQEKPIAQLVVAIEIANQNYDEESSSYKHNTLPENVAIEDTSPLLPAIIYENPNDFCIPELNLYQQLFILCYCRFTYYTYPKDNILVEQLKPYIEIVNKNPKSWIISIEALLWRNTLEFDSVKRMERALKQYEALCENFRNYQPTGNERLYKWICSNSQTIWFVQNTYAEKLRKIGCYKAALDIYERLYSYDRMIECYIQLGRHEKAEEIIRKLLHDEPHSSHLYCLLGQVTNNIKYYEKAWELSNYRSWRSQKMLGLYYLDKNLEKCHEFLKKSLEINSLQEGLWFTLGCIQMKLKKFKEAITSFLHCTRLEPDNAECWSNLATVHIQRNNFVLAYQIMKEAVRYNFNNFKIWENFLYVCMELGRLQDIIYISYRLIDFNIHAIPDDLFAMLVYSFKFENSPKFGYKVEKLKDDIFKLFKEYSNKANPSWKFWKMYASLYEDLTDANSITYNMDYNVKAFRILVYEEKLWETDQKARNHVEIVTMDLLNCGLKISKNDTIVECDKEKYIHSLYLLIFNLEKRCKCVIDELKHSPNIKLKEDLKIFNSKIEDLCKQLNQLLMN